MPYVPSLKIDADDRERIDAVVEPVAEELAKNTTTNFSLAHAYKNVFNTVGMDLIELQKREMPLGSTVITKLAEVIFDVGRKYNYEGAFLGELNYAMTRLIQRVPQLKVVKKYWLSSSELRYWLYAVTTESLLWASDKFVNSGIGIGGVFIDIKDEYKRRVNTAYEAAQIVKSGDCYDAPYYTRLIEVLDGNGKHLGYQEVMLKRSESTVDKDIVGTLKLNGPKVHTPSPESVTKTKADDLVVQKTKEGQKV